MINNSAAIKALHINSTAPYFANHTEAGEYHIDDFEILSTILSALKWRQNNGQIKLYTDEIGFQYYEKLGILDIWSEIDIETLERVRKDYNINHASFWAAGKIFALKKEAGPCFMIDTDFIVWKKVRNLVNNINDTMVIHKEELLPHVYIAREFLKTPPGYSFDQNWNWKELACNNAFCYFGNDNLIKYYTDKAIEFMNNNLEDACERISQMVFAEQRLLAMCAQKLNVPIKTFVEKVGNNLQKQEFFTHVWGFKYELRHNFIKRKQFCDRMINRIIKDHPEYEEKIRNIILIN